ncbi:GNAT family N-acetyltransferase [Paenibacillus sp. GCM10012306]|uniref:GNAT family N-acetyltransferase n=1 Tax=Paenibacillus sp. GCM10012306 TaxID=3317342 RepID=UPI003615429A
MSGNNFLNDVAFEKIKTEILNTYNVKNNVTKPKVIFNEIDIANDKERMYDSFSDSYIPLKYIQFADGEIVISVISDYIDFAKGFYRLFSENLFSEEAFDYVFEFLSVEVKRFKLAPYTGHQEKEKYLSIFGLSAKANITSSNIQNSTIPFNSDTSNKNITHSYEELMLDRVYYGTLHDNKIVSIVGCNNAPSLSPIVVDIGLETHEDYRQKGYALSNVAAMSNYLISNGHVVKYCCNNKNTNSIKTAISSGFKVVANEKTFWCVNP